jgi:hypothetical protein
MKVGTPASIVQVCEAGGKDNNFEDNTAQVIKKSEWTATAGIFILASITYFGKGDKSFIMEIKEFGVMKNKNEVLQIE